MVTYRLTLAFLSLSISVVPGVDVTKAASGPLGSAPTFQQLDGFLSLGGQPSAQLSRDPLPAGIGFSFSSAPSADSTDLTLTYEFTNESRAPLDDVTFQVLADAEIRETKTTFFNESSAVSGTLAPGQNYEIDEPGFDRGDLFDPCSPDRWMERAAGGAHRRRVRQLQVHGGSGSGRRRRGRRG